MTALILWVPARILLLCTRGFVQQYSSSTSNVNVFSCVHIVLMNKLAGKMCFQMQYLRGGSLKFTAFQCCHPQSPRADVTFWIVKLPCAPLDCYLDFIFLGQIPKCLSTREILWPTLDHMVLSSWRNKQLQLSMSTLYYLASRKRKTREFCKML